MCWNSGEGTRTYSFRPDAWLNRVGLSHVSNDCRMTFFSSAARIWSQGLSAEVGVVANAIVQSLPIPPGVAPGGSFAEFQATASSRRNANRFALACLTAVNLSTTGPPRRNQHRGCRVKFVTRNARNFTRNFRNGPDSSTNRGRCNPLFTQVFCDLEELHQGW